MTRLLLGLANVLVGGFLIVQARSVPERGRLGFSARQLQIVLTVLGAFAVVIGVAIMFGASP